MHLFLYEYVSTTNRMCHLKKNLLFLSPFARHLLCCCTLQNKIQTKAHKWQAFFHQLYYFSARRFAKQKENFTIQKISKYFNTFHKSVTAIFYEYFFFLFCLFLVMFCCVCAFFSHFISVVPLQTFYNSIHWQAQFRFLLIP